MKKWECKACGYIHDGDEEPKKCLKCGATNGVFIPLDETVAKQIERSRHTNVLHARLIDLARQVEAVCNDGIRDELDPACVRVFTSSREMAWNMMKFSMTEQRSHMRKKKWG